MKSYLAYILFSLLLAVIPGCSQQENHSAETILESGYELQIKHVKDFVQRHGYNTRYCFLVDYSRPSGKERFFVADLDSMKLVEGFAGLVCHGNCAGAGSWNTSGIPEYFSNEEGSGCSSLGMSVVAERAYSGWGRNYKYWLDGVEDSNHNMRRRIVVLHGWEGVPNAEIHPSTLVMSEGCFTVSPDFLDRLDGLILEEREAGRWVLVYGFH